MSIKISRENISSFSLLILARAADEILFSLVKYYVSPETRRDSRVGAKRNSDVALLDRRRLFRI